MFIYSNRLVVLVVIVYGLTYVRGIEFETLRHLKTRSDVDIQRESVKQLLYRVIGSRSTEFNVSLDSNLGPEGKDTFKIITKNGLQEITGTTGVAVAMGFYYYIKYYCNGQFTWAGQQLNLPAVLPKISSPILKTTNDRFRYYQNVCTVSYSLVWLKWTRWERHIDWMAMQGINLPLAFTGQEAIFQRVYMNLGYSFEDMEEHFGGPAFLAWARMGNIHGWGGPLPETWIADKLALQHKILDRMRSLGMIPVLPGFAGHVPAATKRLFPNSQVSKLPDWSHFNDTYSATYLLDFQDPLFKKIGSSFIKEMKREFGVDHIYNADSFNEMTPKSSEPSYLASASKAVYEAMLEGDSQAIWLMQGWLFHSLFWGPAQIKALLTSIPQGKMIVLDLNAELSPIYARTQSFYGQPFIWCMLHNFGGTMEMYGTLDPVNKGPFIGRNFTNSSMIGIGITPEGIYQNEVMYEFMNENAWRAEPRNITLWMSQYVQQRYGQFNIKTDEAWHILQSSVYNCTNGHGDFDEVFFTRRPGIGSPTIWYKPSDLYSAWDNMVNSSVQLSNSTLFRYDLVDITRNSLQVISMKMYSDIIMAYNNKNITALKLSGDMLIKLLSDLDVLLKSNRNFLLGNWIDAAKSWAINHNQSALYEYNARNQITLWGPDGEIVDYASKQWAGLLLDYYKPRWQLFIDTLMNCVKTGQKFNEQIFKAEVFSKVEQPFTFSRKIYPTKPSGDSVSIAQTLHRLYRPQTLQQSSYYNKLKKWTLAQKYIKKNVRKWRRKYSGKLDNNVLQMSI